MTNEAGAWSPGDAQRLYAILAEMAAAGEAGAVATVIRTSRSAPRHSGSKMIVRADGTVTGSVGGGTVEATVLEAAREVIAEGICRRLVLNLDGEAGVCGGETEVFIEPVTAAVRFWIVGAGHIGRAVIELGAQLPFRFTVVDDRSEYLGGLEPVATLNVAPAELGEHLQPTARMAILLANRNHELDGDYLEAVLAAEQAAGQEVAYLGVVGSRTKANVLSTRFRDRPERRERFRRISIPVGLAVGAETPHEVALSILAEALAEIRGVTWFQDGAGSKLGVYLQRKRPVPPRTGSTVDAEGTSEKG